MDSWPLRRGIGRRVRGPGLQGVGFARSSRFLGPALLLALACFLGEAAFASPPYSLQHSTTDAGGGLARSTHYRLVSSLGLPGGLTGSATGRIQDRRGFVGLLNDPPLPLPDTVRTGPDFLAKVRMSGLLANDWDAEGDVLTLRRFDPFSVAGGRVTLDAGWLLYEPPRPFPGLDEFRYAVEDPAGNLGVALVTVLLAELGNHPSQNLIAITLLPSGHRYLAFAGIAGREYLIEWTDRLPATRWETLARVMADRQGFIEWVDTTTPAPPERYYRTRSP